MLQRFLVVVAFEKGILEMLSKNCHTDKDIASEVEALAPVHVVQQITALDRNKRGGGRERNT